MADRVHHLKFSLKAADWADAEKNAARIIRLYTRENQRGKGATSDDQVLRDARFTADDMGDDGLWNITVEVDT